MGEALKPDGAVRRHAVELLDKRRVLRHEEQQHAITLARWAYTVGHNIGGL